MTADSIRDILQSADERGVIEWRETLGSFPTWKAGMEYLTHAGYVTERAGGGYNLTPLGLRTKALPPPEPASSEPESIPKPPAPPKPRKARGTKRSRSPRLTPAIINQIVADLPVRAKERKDDAEDRRCLRGKYAPPKGVCRVCAGEVIAEIEFMPSRMIGGPLPQAYIVRYYCTVCQLLYRDLPPSPKPL